MSYTAMVMLPTAALVSLEQVEAKLRSALNSTVAGQSGAIEVFREETQLTLFINDWSLYIWADASPTVLEETQSIVELFGCDRTDQAELATYGFRFDISCDADPDLEYFDDYVRVLKAMKEFPQAVVFDPEAESFI
ncbi:hypothetical protein [Myxacorys almedinensis]|uniref:Uncharacterized protein n=1 Tax=Myxacorys almedinensis A TaxID=2690445 RepID=A0A8J7Z071_9CYAN|nr:hypothetical protein [Myxacorys almedinensis]NDJ17737.1 hypothetical protein [Myxacorys almedinensis A]